MVSEFPLGTAPNAPAATSAHSWLPSLTASVGQTRGSHQGSAESLSTRLSVTRETTWRHGKGKPRGPVTRSSMRSSRAQTQHRLARGTSVGTMLGPRCRLTGSGGQVLAALLVNCGDMVPSATVLNPTVAGMINCWSGIPNGKF